MAVVDPTRATLITKEYRYKIKEVSSIQAQYPNARSIEFDTTLDLAGATALADSLFAQTSTIARTFTMEIEDTQYPEDFIGGFPRFSCAFDRHPAAAGVSSEIGAQIDFFNNRSSIMVRG